MQNDPTTASDRLGSWENGRSGLMIAPATVTSETDRLEKSIADLDAAVDSLGAHLGGAFSEPESAPDGAYPEPVRESPPMVARLETLNDHVGAIARRVQRLDRGLRL